ncbi:alanine racemase [Anaeroselena agilis]|uniref:Alanine racemase n=1 Tax=Anaeroselena agilis TaxID=3063788 RepID=A0ABU3P412_9FIRM|nr:alanine racemase [Selenomonadales bacterium 4137-cl]
MNIRDLATPSFLLDLDVFEANLRDMAAMCGRAGVELWPMVKTHKSTVIARWQKEAGAAGFLTGTLDEAEQLAAAGFADLTLAYPVAGRANIDRIIALARRARITVSLDGIAAARALAAALAGAGLEIDYLIIIDSGLHRFGVPPHQAAELAAALSGYKKLRLRGVATHPGQVYGAGDREGVAAAAAAEVAALAQAREVLLSHGFAVDTVAAGSTPTAAAAAASGVVTALRPGNYVFYDNTQVALGVVPPARCALAVLATVLSRPRPDTLIIDAGSKCLGLDKGAHGSSLLAGFGLVAGHPELTVAGLSEEVGRVAITGETGLDVGDKLAVIPNHACAAANLTGWLIGHRQGNTECAIPIDMRGNSRLPATF